MRLRAISSVSAAALINTIFGDKPLEIKLVRSKNKPVSESDPVTWRWSVELPLDNRAAERLFEAITLESIQVDDLDQAAAVSITTSRTNIGYETRFAFVNASFREGGRSKLEKSYMTVKKWWDDSVQTIKLAWPQLQDELQIQVVEIALRDPTIANRLTVGVKRIERCPNCKTFHPALLGDVLDTVFGDSNITVGVLQMHDRDAAFSNSGFDRPVLKLLNEQLRELVKQGMIEFMGLSERSILQDVPVQLVDQLRQFASSQQVMKAMGMEIQTDPRLDLLITTLKTFAAESNQKPTDDVVGPPPPPPGAGAGEQPSVGVPTN